MRNIYQNLGETQVRAVTAIFMFLAIFMVFLLDFIFNTIYFSLIFTGCIFAFCTYEFSKILQLNENQSILYSSILTSFSCFILFADLSIRTFFFSLSFIFWSYILFSFYKFQELKFFKFKILFSVLIIIFAVLGAKFFLVERRDAILIPFLIVWINDIGAYFFGRKYGSRKLIENVSPGKSVEGALGGIWFCLLLVGLLLIFQFDFHFFLTFFVVCFLSVMSITGDLTESYFKRVANMKDSGTFLPGHGGFLDRLDSLLSVLPLTALLFQIF